MIVLKFDYFAFIEWCRGLTDELCGCCILLFMAWYRKCEYWKWYKEL